MKAKIYRDPVVEAYMPGVDRTLLRENLKLTFEQRIEKHTKALRLFDALQRSRKLHQNHTRFLKTTEDIFNYAAEQGVSEEEAFKKSMEEKSKEFVEKGAEV